MPRKYERVEFVAEIELESTSGRREVRITDLSYGGCYVDSIISVNVGEQVEFDLLHANGNKLRFTGEVAYHFNGIGFGVRFTEVSDEQKIFLERMIG